MRPRTTLSIIVGLQTAALWCSSAYAQSAPKLSLKLERIPSEAASANTVRMRLQITNVSLRAVDVLAPEFETDFTFVVVGPDGRPAPPTKAAEARRSLPQGGGSHVLVTLPPGQSVFRTWVLSDLVDFSKPGRYRVLVSRRFGELGEMDSSNVAEISVP